ASSNPVGIMAFFTWSRLAFPGSTTKMKVCVVARFSLSLLNTTSRRWRMKHFSAILAATLVSMMAAFPVFAQDSPSAQVVGVVKHGDTTIVFERSNAGL